MFLLPFDCKYDTSFEVPQHFIFSSKMWQASLEQSSASALGILLYRTVRGLDFSLSK
jgi:hypothetical protein